MLCRLTIALLTIALACGAAKQTALTGKVIGVTDGDTIKVLVDESPIRVRLYGIDAPEGGQPFGKSAKKRLSELCYGKQCRLIDYGKDKYGRTLAIVLIDGSPANLRLVEDGLAWHYTKYVKSKSLAIAEKKARTKKRGLWSDPNRVPPWEWRKLSKNERVLAVTGRDGKAVAPLGKTLTHWLNTKTGVRHNSSCRWYGSTKNGRRCLPADGKACGQCGG